MHVEVHPDGGGPLDPKPLLDRYDAEALEAARATVAAFDSRALVKADRVDPVPPALLPRSGDLPLISTVLALAARLDAGSGEAPTTNG